MLTGILRNGSGLIEATGLVPASHPLVSEGRAPCFLGLELGAQAAAAQEALGRAASTGQSSARIGQVARVREADFLQPHLPIDTPLRVTAKLEAEAPPLAIYQISVVLDGVEFLRAILSTHSGPR